ncbi:adenylyltransferase/cytidyltransferase family protein [Paenibacillus sp. KACC 21273]|uniref:adenylyltransferase/cytidyltransferase family protein n=1 Tax=Paenibacillus sp. KACC 21273 TaxID=3025665 RepID=UPI0023668B6F|nr:adenylyltransferase/cytidyltransferase family protein [Paenibacillus sp. KACC 21273]WDF52846.1 adenylyltransferase/cytidyltransferase family protein [Paenibacillus sp. KACC 21273]
MINSDRDKICNRKQLVTNLDEEKANGKTIVLGGGCFDVFHIGFLNYLKEAKKLGDVLVVGVNTDQSVKRAKKNPPLFDEEQRLYVVSSLECVDYVFKFDEDTLEASIREIVPHIFVKGADYVDKQVLEETAVKSLGIGLKLVGDKANSSVEVVKKFNQRFLEK